MNAEMWEKVKQRAHELRMELNSGKVNQLLIYMNELEKETIRERVAEILENTNHTEINNNPVSPTENRKHHSEIFFPTIAEALRTGDTTEIEKWVKK